MTQEPIANVTATLERIVATLRDRQPEDVNVRYIIAKLRTLAWYFEDAERSEIAP